MKLEINDPEKIEYLKDFDITYMPIDEEKIKDKIKNFLNKLRKLFKIY